MKKLFTKERLRELFAYGIWGVVTMLVNILSYQLFLFLGIDYRISNLISLLLTKLLAYVVNKLFVFKSRCSSFKELCFEFFRYVVARGFTGLVDYFGLIVAVELFSFNEVYSKYVLQVIVILLNFVLGKKAVFTSKKSDESKDEPSD